MSARRFDSPLRYMVESRSATESEHLVELDSYDGNGSCACPHFTFRLEPPLKEGAKPSNATRCFHICEARDKFIDDVISLIHQRQKETGLTKKEKWHA